MRRILLTMIAIALLAPFVAMAGSEPFPPQELIGTWIGNVEIFGSKYKTDPYPSTAPEDNPAVTVTIHSDGTVTGGIGDALFKQASVHKNRGWLGRKLNLKSDYIVSGGMLQGKVTSKDKGTDNKFTVPFDLKDGRFEGTIMLLPKFPLTRPMYLTRERT